MKNNYVLIFLTTFLLMFISTAYAAFSSELIISGDGLVEKDNIAPTCGSWYLRDSDLTVQEAYNQNKFKNPATNTTWTNKNQKLFIECTDNMEGDYGCINVTEITDSNNQKRYYKEVKEYTTSIKTDGVISITLSDAYLNTRTCTLPAGGSNPYLDKVAPEITITQSDANKFTYLAEDNFEVLGYMVTTTSTEPDIDDPNWLTEPEEITIDNTSAKTYYVWAKDGVNISHETINTYLLTKTEGTGTTLTIKYNNSTGAELSTGYVLDGTNIYVEASAETGYSSLTITNNETNIANQSIQTVNAATTIRSNAVASTYIVNYDSNGGTGTMPAQIMLYGVQRKLTKNTFTKVGYSFIGWNTMDDGTGINYSDEESVVDIASPATSNMVTLYAKWKAEAVFDTGINVNVKIKQLAGDTSPDYNTDNTSITSIVKSTTEPSAENKTTEHIVSDSTLSVTPIYMWYDNGTIYWWSEDDTPSFNSNSSQMFRQLLNLTSIDLSNFDTSNTTSMQSLFYGDSAITSINLSNFDTSNVTDMSYMFYNNTSLTSIDLSNFDTSNVTYMKSMFYNNTSLTSIDLSNFDTSNVIDMSWMFSGCSSFTNLDVSSFNTSKVTNMRAMFQSNSALTNITFGNNFNTSKVINMRFMFSGCHSLESIDLSSFDMSIVTDSTNMLYSTSALKSLKTPNIYPSDVSIKINLPRTFIEIDGTESTNKYEKLDNTSPTKTWIYVEVWAKDLSYSNKYTNVGCYDSQCMIDYISNVLEYNDINILADDNLFVTNKGMYIRRSGKLILFKINNYNEEYNHIQSVFSDGTCTSLTDATGLRCVASDFHCTVISTGYVDCHDYTTGKSCDISPAGDIHCTE